MNRYILPLHVPVEAGGAGDVDLALWVGLVPGLFVIRKYKIVAMIAKTPTTNTNGSIFNKGVARLRARKILILHHGIKLIL